MAFAAGYVAFDGLGISLDRASPHDLAAVPSTWLQTLIRGRLYIPSIRWMEVMRSFEVNFKVLMGNTASQEPGIMKKLVEMTLLKNLQLDQRVAR